MQKDNKFMKNLPVGILDSGVGGLTALSPMQEILPDESVIYFGDSLRMPYGNRTKEEIVFYAQKMIDYLENKGVKAILLACNTISSHIDSLHSNVKLFSIVQAGVEEVKQSVKGDSLGIIATCATVNSGVYENALSEVCPDMKVTLNSSISLPKIIDSQMENEPLLRENIKECIEPIVTKDPAIKDLVLGCSHFPIIKNEINGLYPKLNLIDPAIRQVKMLKEYLDANELNNKSKKTITLYTTAETYEFAAAIKRLKLEIDTLMKVELI
ncbi:MAG: glutamate racemase [Anaerofustis stercorihominis]|nr:glutamate racemase [Anaerofustis stercorihominis]